MAELLELIERVDAARADISTLFGKDGTPARSGRRSKVYEAKYPTAVKFIGDVFAGKRPMWQLKEAMSTDDFPLMFGDTIDRVLLAKYQTLPSPWRQFLKVSTVADFRNVKRFRCTRGAGVLDPVPQGGSYKADSIGESYYTFTIGKYGRRRDYLWEAIINDDLDALRDTPDDLAYQASNTENYVASGYYVANTTLFATTGGGRPTGGNKGTGALNMTNLKAAINQMTSFYDENGQPINNVPKFLIIPPQLQLAAMEILNSLQIVVAGQTDTVLPNTNVLANILTPIVDPWMPILDTTNGKTSWYLFADPNMGWGVEIAFLRGHETPELFMKSPNQLLLTGGESNVMDGDFDTDSIAYKVRHVIGGSHSNAVGGWRFCYWSDGTTT